MAPGSKKDTVAKKPQLTGYVKILFNPGKKPITFNQGGAMGPYEKASDILVCLHKINTKYGKLYSYPSQKYLLVLLKKYHNIKYSIATLNRRLRDIEAAELIKRTRRSINDKKLGKVFQSTLYEIKIKGYKHLMKLGVKVFNIIKNVINGRNGEKKKQVAAARVNGDGYPLITYAEHIKNI